MPTHDHRKYPAKKERFTLASWVRPIILKSTQVGHVDEPRDRVKMRAAGVCVSRAGVERIHHDLDKDGRCCFCDQFPPPEPEPS